MPIEIGGVRHASNTKLEALCGTRGARAYWVDGEVTYLRCRAILRPEQPVVPAPRFKAQSSLNWTAPTSNRHYLSTKERGPRLDYPRRARGGNSKPKHKAYRRMPRGNWKGGR